MMVSSKIPTKLFLVFYPEMFCTFLGASWGLPGDLVGNIINKEAYRKPTGSPKKLPGSPQDGTQNFRAEVLEIISLVFWKKLSFHKDIIKLTDL